MDVDGDNSIYAQVRSLWSLGRAFGAPLNCTLGISMKLIIAFLAAAISSGLCHAECMGQAEAANSFMNEYKKHSDDSLHKKTKESTDQWVQRNTKITDHFKSSYKNLVEEANKKDPEMGLDFDPIFDAQDYPDQGFKILSCDEKSNFVTLNCVFQTKLDTHSTANWTVIPAQTGH